MEFNLHTPQRHAGEAFDAYQLRRFDSRRAAERITLSGPWTPGGQSSRAAFRDQLRRNGKMHKHAGAYGRGLRNAITKRNRLQQAERLGKKMAGV